MRKVIIAIAATFATSMSGCAVQKTLTPVGGSRSDGTIRLAYSVSMFEKPVVDWTQGSYLARQRCAAWGYSDAESFGGSTQQCEAYNGYGNCVQATIFVDYQCTGQPEAIAPAPTSIAKPTTATYENHPGG